MFECSEYVELVTALSEVYAAATGQRLPVAFENRFVVIAAV